MQIRFGFSGVSPTVSDPLYFLCQYNFALHSKSDSRSHSSDHLIFPIFSHLILLIIGFTDVNPLSRRNFVQTSHYQFRSTPKRLCRTCKAMSMQTVLDFWLMYAEEHVTAFAKGASLESYLNEIRCS